MNYDAHFYRSKSRETLLIMLKALCRRHNLIYDESLSSYRQAAKSYKQLGNHLAHKIFCAAAKRLDALNTEGELAEEAALEQALKGGLAKESPIKVTEISVDIYRGLQNEIEAYRQRKSQVR